MSRVIGKVEVERKDGVGASSETKYGVYMKCGGQEDACRKLESSQKRMGRRLLGESNTIAGVAVQGDLGWKKLEERREEMKVMFGKRLAVFEKCQLVKKSGK